MLKAKRKELAANVDEESLGKAMVDEILSVANTNKIGKPKAQPVQVVKRQTSPTDWRNLNSPSRLWADLESLI